jgi:hypothetical protein
MNEFEQLLAQNVLNPASIDVSVGDVKGQEALIGELVGSWWAAG